MISALSPPKSSHFTMETSYGCTSKVARATSRSRTQFEAPCRRTVGWCGLRNRELGWRRIVYLLGSPALVPVLYFRIARNVLGKRTHRRELLTATPLIIVYLCTWALGEAVGYAFGGGRSILKVR